MTLFEIALENFKFYYSFLYNQAIKISEGGPREVIALLSDGTLISYYDRDRTFRSLPSDSKNMTEEEYKRELGIRLRQMMEHRGVTQNDLSEMTGLSQAQISSYVTGKVSPSFYVIDRIAKALDCSSDLLRYNFNI